MRRIDRHCQATILPFDSVVNERSPWQPKNLANTFLVFLAVA